MNRKGNGEKWHECVVKVLCAKKTNEGEHTQGNLLECKVTGQLNQNSSELAHVPNLLVDLDWFRL